jgi:hypothetical protein
VSGNWPDVERPFTAWGSSSGRGLGPAHHSAYLACVRGLPLPQEEQDRQEQEEEEEREGEIERDATTHQRSTAVSEIGKKMTLSMSYIKKNPFKLTKTRFFFNSHLERRFRIRIDNTGFLDPRFGICTTYM